MARPIPDVFVRFPHTPMSGKILQLLFERMLPYGGREEKEDIRRPAPRPAVTCTRETLGVIYVCGSPGGHRVEVERLSWKDSPAEYRLNFQYADDGGKFDTWATMPAGLVEEVRELMEEAARFIRTAESRAARQ